MKKIIGAMQEASYVYEFEANAQTLKQANAMAVAYWHDGHGPYEKHHPDGKPLSLAHSAARTSPAAHLIRGRGTLINCYCRD